MASQDFMYIAQFRCKATQSALQEHKITFKDIFKKVARQQETEHE